MVVVPESPQLELEQIALAATARLRVDEELS